MRIGICTLYYNNKNYGANLQAYALSTYLKSLGNHVEMVSYCDDSRLHHFLYSAKQLLFKSNDKISDKIKLRNASIDSFNKSLNHTKLYYSNTIKRVNSKFDCFITGSDQVWNPDWINPYLGLEFADSSKLTISYAASLGRIYLDKEQEERLNQALKQTKYISIREKDSIPALQKLTSKKIEYVLDPTMLLSKTDWDKICSKRIIGGEYLFCFYLGNDCKNLRDVAKEYAKLKNLKLVTMPYLNGAYRQVDDGFGDYQIFAASPNDFLSLIKYSSFVMTDSFHATVFSHIYEKPFIASGGSQQENECRIISLTKLFGTEYRHIKEHEDVTVEKLLDIEQQPLALRKENYNEILQQSLSFLEEALNDNK